MIEVSESEKAQSLKEYEIISALNSLDSKTLEKVIRKNNTIAVPIMAFILRWNKASEKVSQETMREGFCFPECEAEPIDFEREKLAW